MPTDRQQEPHAIRLFIGKMLAAVRAYPAQWRALRAMPSGPPILVTGAHRTGTTWVGGMLATPGVWHVHEPFNEGKGVWNENFAYAAAGDTRPDIDRVMSRLLRGGLRQVLNMPWCEHALMPMRWMPHRPRRVMVKDPLACLMSEYLTERFGMRTLVLFRHPCGFVGSVTRLGWPSAHALQQFLKNDRLMGDWLEPVRGEMVAASRSDDLRAAATLYGCLSRVLWGYVGRTQAMKALVFEKLCLDPISIFRDLFEELGLPYDESVRLQHERLCFGSKPNRAYRTHAIHRDSAAMAERWRKEISSEDARTVREVWQRFGVPLYEEDAEW